MAKYQKKPSLADLARRRGQSVLEVLQDWGLGGLEGEAFELALKKRCLKEGVDGSGVALAKPALKSALVELPKKAPAPVVKSDVKSDKKAVKGKVTSDEPAASDKHDGVDPVAPAGPEDPA